MAEVAARGYLAEEQGVPTGPQASKRRRARPRPVDVVVKMYAEPGQG